MQEIAERRVGDSPGLLVIDATPNRCGELTEDERRISVLAAVLCELEHHRVLVFGWSADRQRQAPLTLAAGQGAGLPDSLCHNVELVHDQ